MSSSPSRRQALQAATAAALSPALANLTNIALAAGAVAAGATAPQPPICAFTKPFNSLSFDELADRIAELGFDGIEAPIRAGGHVEPREVEERLPQLVEALKKRNLEICVMTSDINDPQDALSRKVLHTAAGLGIRRYRMQYFKYDLKLPVLEQLRGWQSQIRELADLNRELGMIGLYQNHAGRDYMGAAIWDLQQVLTGIPVEHLAVAYDIRHATVEAGTSWPVSLSLIAPHLDTIYVKDFEWSQGVVRNVPLGEGQVDPAIIQQILGTRWAGPISLHEEYLDHQLPELVPAHLQALAKDLAKLRQWLPSDNRQ